MRLIITAMLGLMGTTALTSATSINNAQDDKLEARHLYDVAKTVQLEARGFKIPSPIPGRPGRIFFKNRVDENGNRRDLTPEEKKERMDSLKFYRTLGGAGALATTAVTGVLLADHNQEKIRKAHGGSSKRAVDTEHQLKARDPAKTPHTPIFTRPLGPDGKPRPRTKQEKKDWWEKVRLIALGSTASAGVALGFGALAYDRIMKDKEEHARGERKAGETEVAHPEAVHRLKVRDPAPPARKPFYIISKPVDEHGNPRELTPEEKRRRLKALGWGAFIGTVVTGAAVGLGVDLHNNNEDRKKGYKRSVDTEGVGYLETRNTKRTRG